MISAYKSLVKTECGELQNKQGPSLLKELSHRSRSYSALVCQDIHLNCLSCLQGARLLWGVKTSLEDKSERQENLR